MVREGKTRREGRRGERGGEGAEEREGRKGGDVKKRGGGSALVVVGIDALSIHVQCHKNGTNPSQGMLLSVTLN